ncbi:hypothetical protein PPACK8108_LOCUS13695 [Phakopsora pachyrhizi]|uniref:Uncharacterized protein n=1 Tax=Phakopsora pachyrhizi TaxID=170000 RepID=A0AAV0B556_PHAPC|nr:hypothetical protein PPACK8108_LOCUS13695 [Phakopsora pachyrhizi]
MTVETARVCIAVFPAYHPQISTCGFWLRLGDDCQLAINPEQLPGPRGSLAGGEYESELMTSEADVGFAKDLEREKFDLSSSPEAKDSDFLLLNDLRRLGTCFRLDSFNC